MLSGVLRGAKVVCKTAFTGSTPAPDSSLSEEVATRIQLCDTEQMFGDIDAALRSKGPWFIRRRDFSWEAQQWRRIAGYDIERGYLWHIYHQLRGWQRKYRELQEAYAERGKELSRLRREIESLRRKAGK